MARMAIVHLEADIGLEECVDWRSPGTFQRLWIKNQYGPHTDDHILTKALLGIIIIRFTITDVN